MAMIASLVIILSNVECCELLVEPLLELAYNVPKCEMICHIISPNSQWYIDFYAYLHDNILPPNLSNNAQKSFICGDSHYAILADTQYHPSLDGTLIG